MSPDLDMGSYEDKIEALQAEVERLREGHRFAVETARRYDQENFTLRTLLLEMLACTENEHHPERWHIRRGSGKRFSQAIRAARAALAAVGGDPE